MLEFPLRFILTMRNVNERLEYFNKEINECFILTMRNVNTEEIKNTITYKLVLY